MSAQILQMYRASPMPCMIGKTVTATFRDRSQVRGRVLSADSDLGTVTVVWEDGVKMMACTFKAGDAVSIRTT